MLILFCLLLLSQIQAVIILLPPLLVGLVDLQAGNSCLPIFYPHYFPDLSWDISSLILPMALLMIQNSTLEVKFIQLYMKWDTFWDSLADFMQSGLIRVPMQNSAQQMSTRKSLQGFFSTKPI